MRDLFSDSERFWYILGVCNAIRYGVLVEQPPESV